MLQSNSLPPCTAPTASGWSDSCRAGFAPTGIQRLSTAHLKNQGYHLEHNFGHGDQRLSEAFFVLNLLAFFMHQIFDLVDGQYQRVPYLLHFPPCILGRSARCLPDLPVHLLELVLARMNSPPEPLPPYQDR